MNAYIGCQKMVTDQCLLMMMMNKYIHKCLHLMWMVTNQCLLKMINKYVHECLHWMWMVTNQCLLMIIINRCMHEGLHWLSNDYCHQCLLTMINRWVYIITYISCQMLLSNVVACQMCWLLNVVKCSLINIC